MCDSGMPKHVIVSRRIHFIDGRCIESEANQHLYPRDMRPNLFSENPSMGKLPASPIFLEPPLYASRPTTLALCSRG